LQKVVGEFVVKPILLEQLSNIANHDLLYQLADRNNGKIYLNNAFNEIQNDIAARKDVTPLLNSIDQLANLINKKLLFFVLLVLLSFEWFMRKRNGTY
jgi:hypothetical protein